MPLGNVGLVKALPRSTRKPLPQQASFADLNACSLGVVYLSVALKFPHVTA